MYVHALTMSLIYAIPVVLLDSCSSEDPSSVLGATLVLALATGSTLSWVNLDVGRDRGPPDLLTLGSDDFSPVGL